jgi:hypothetical protein
LHLRNERTVDRAAKVPGRDGTLLANPHATLAARTFEKWLDSNDANVTT